MHPVDERPFRVCVFQVAGERFGLRLESVTEIVAMAALSRPPAMPSVLEGFLNLGGTAIPVVRTAALLGLSPDCLDVHTPLVIIRAGALALALLVSRVLGIVPVPAGGLLPIEAADSFNGCVEGRLLVADDSVHLLSVERLLLEKEQRTVAEFQVIETRRLRQIETVTA